jgi:hypothetical protein
MVNLLIKIEKLVLMLEKIENWKSSLKYFSGCATDVYH